LSLVFSLLVLRVSFFVVVFFSFFCVLLLWGFFFCERDGGFQFLFWCGGWGVGGCVCLLLVVGFCVGFVCLVGVCAALSEFCRCLDFFACFLN